MIDNIGIIGGGTAGLITALLVRSRYPLLDITVIESDNIGIVGVGEGSTEHWKDFMFDCQIDLAELIERTDATFKYGINFENWHGDNTNYFHSVSSNFAIESQTRHKIMYAYQSSISSDPLDLVNKYVIQSTHIKPYWGINQFHFNTFKLNEYLHELCEKRRIKIVKTEIDSVNVDDNGIKFLTTVDKKRFEYDLYVDSTGFHRLLASKNLKVKWRSYKKYLPMDSAIAFPTEKTETLESWTLSRALSSGWNWRIPTQNRYGNGYVFSSDFLNFSQAENEIKETYGDKIEIAKRISFDAGCLEQAWTKNCVAIGLSYSFIEPLEASSIGSSIIQANLLIDSIAAYDKRCDNSFIIKNYNKNCDDLLENILEFVALHYITRRHDTEFWKFAKNLPKPDGLQEKLDRYRYTFPSLADFPNHYVMFKENNWIIVLHALGLLKKETAEQVCSLVDSVILENIQRNLQRQKADIEESIKLEGLSHRDALKWLVDNKGKY